MTAPSSIFVHLSARLSTAGAQIIEEVGRLWGLRQCRQMRPDDLEGLRAAVDRASRAITVYDACLARGVTEMTFEDFAAELKPTSKQGGPR